MDRKKIQEALKGVCACVSVHVFKGLQGFLVELEPNSDQFLMPQITGCWKELMAPVWPAGWRSRRWHFNTWVDQHELCFGAVKLGEPLCFLFN